MLLQEKHLWHRMEEEVEEQAQLELGNQAKQASIVQVLSLLLQKQCSINSKNKILLSKN